MNKDKMIEFAKDQCEIFPEDSYMGKYLRETLKMLQAGPCEDAPPDTNVWNKKVEELRMEKHTDKQIYDGCILLMQNMVDYFQEYLDYLGYDLDKLDEDERFFIGISNMEIVRQLFLYQTGNSGGCSTKDFCEKLGVDPYKSVKFKFEESEEI